MSGTPAAKTALPQPPKIYQNVPKNSANNFFVIIYFFKVYYKVGIFTKNNAIKSDYYFSKYCEVH